MGPGGPHGLQNRRVASSGVIDGFDSHSLPPFVFSCLQVLRTEIKMRLIDRKVGSVIKT